MPTLSEQHLADVLRYYGLGLQLAGLATAALGIRSVRREWTERLGIGGATARALSQTWHLLQQRIAERWRGLRRKPRVVHLGSVGSELNLAWSGDAKMSIPDPPADQAIEDRVAWLERYLLVTFAHSENVRTALTKETSERNAALTAEQTTRDQRAEQLQGSIGRLAGGGLTLQAWGLVALALGITLAAIPDKLAAL